jgi:hypothetical protein
MAGNAVAAINKREPPTETGLRKQSALSAAQNVHLVSTVAR